MNRRVERLHPPVEDLREPGDVGHRQHRHPSLGQRPLRPPGREDLDPHLRESLGEFHQAAFVVHRDQRSSGFQHGIVISSSSEFEEAGASGTGRSCQFRELPQVAPARP